MRLGAVPRVRVSIWPDATVTETADEEVAVAFAESVIVLVPIAEIVVPAGIPVPLID
jgi:hypothetical protein